MTWTRRLFWFAGIYGLAVLAPQYLMERRVGIDFPPEITHPEYFYGFVGVALAWQVAFLIIGTDPVRYRPMIIPSMIEKFSFAGAAAVLLTQGRVPKLTAAFAGVDFILGVLFAIAYARLSSRVPADEVSK
jgi:hypothetical protein